MIFRRSFSNILPNKSIIFITNLLKKPCIECKNFQKNYNDSKKSSEINLSTCSEFGYKDLISGKVIYDLATECRTNKFKCTVEAKQFR